jgi:thioredoxin reductase
LQLIIKNIINQPGIATARLYHFKINLTQLSCIKFILIHLQAINKHDNYFDYVYFNIIVNMKNKENIFDVAIIGGGAAGLSAALFLTRARRSVAMFDEGRQRIRATPYIHELLGFEGVSPKEFHALAYKEIALYSGSIRRDKVIKIEPADENDYLVYSTTEKVRAKAIIIATGLKDVLPNIPGIKEGWGKDIHICPCFTGYELHNKSILVFGLPERIGQLSKFLTAWSDYITVITTVPFEAVVAKKLAAAGVTIIDDEVTGIFNNNDAKVVTTRSGIEIQYDAIFVAAPMIASSDLAASLCEVDDLGFAKTDVNGKTTREGLWVIGNASDPVAHLAHAIAAGARVGPMVTDYLIDLSLSKLIN